MELQKSLRKEELESQSLQRRLEDAMCELTEQRGLLVEPRLSPEDLLAHEARRGELAEARCALVEARCQQTVQRLEAELVASRQQLDSAQLPERPQVTSELGALPSTSSLSRPGGELASQ